jgi:hypothetical protein
MDGDCTSFKGSPMVLIRADTGGVVRRESGHPPGLSGDDARAAA